MTPRLQQSLAQWQHRPRRQQIGAASLLLLLLTGLGCRVMLLPGWRQVNALAATHVTTRQAIDQHQARLAALAPAAWLNQQIAQLEAQQTRPLAVEKEMPFLLAAPLRQSGSELLNWEPVTGPSPASPLRWRLAIRASYHGLKHFLAAVAGLPLPGIEQMGIEPGPHGLDVTLVLATAPDSAK